MTPVPAAAAPPHRRCAPSWSLRAQGTPLPAGDVSRPFEPLPLPRSTWCGRSPALQGTLSLLRLRRSLPGTRPFGWLSPFRPGSAQWMAPGRLIDSGLSRWFAPLRSQYNQRSCTCIDVEPPFRTNHGARLFDHKSILKPTPIISTRE